jgi:HK97 family phage major capsid protein
VVENNRRQPAAASREASRPPSLSSKGPKAKPPMASRVWSIRVQTGELDVTDADSLPGAIALASAAEVTPNRWFVNGTDFIALRKLKEATDSKKYLLEAEVTSGQTYRLFGVEVIVTNKLKQGKAILADMSQVAIARDEASSVTILSERYADYDQIGIRVVTRYDLGLLHPEAVIVLTDA